MKRFQRWEKRHPVDVENLTKRQLLIRRVAIPLAVLDLVAIIAGVFLLSFEVISFGALLTVVLGLSAACAVLFFLFLRDASTADQTTGTGETQ